MNQGNTVQHCDCTSPLCPLMGTHNRSTSGGADWVCFIHFGSDARNAEAITQELNRLLWLTAVIRALRELPRRNNWSEIGGELHKAIDLSQQPALRMASSENCNQWMIRLEGVLSQSCKDSLAQP